MLVAPQLDVIVAAATEHGSGQPLWAAFALDDAYDGEIALRSGDTIDDIVEAVADHRAAGAPIEAILFNCSLPEQTTRAITELADKCRSSGLDIRIGGYANGFPDERQAGYEANEVIFDRRDDLDASNYADAVAAWVAAGATIVGGCCDMYPEDITELAKRFG